MKNKFSGYIVAGLAFGLIAILLTIVIFESYVALIENKQISDGTLALLQSSITGIVGICAGYISGKNAD